MAGLAVCGGCFCRFDHCLANNTFNIERLSVQLVTGAKPAVYFFGEVVVSVQIIIIGADDDKVVCWMGHRL